MITARTSAQDLPVSELTPAHDVDADLSIFDPPVKAPLLPRILRLRHLQLTWWQRVLFGDVPLALGLLIALADLATAWVIVALPVAVMAMVKLHDVLAGQLAPTGSGSRIGPPGSSPSGYSPYGYNPPV